MIQEERYAFILDSISSKGSVSVRDLARSCSVTAESIRNDLRGLEKMGLLTRTHGGAVKDPIHKEIPHYLREIANVAQKKSIAKAAVNYIEVHDKIILDSSSTSYFVAQALPDIALTVLTNSMRIQQELAEKKEIEVLSTGGILLRSSMCFVGKPAISMLKGYHVNKAFISCTGIHPVMGVSEPNEMAIAVKKAMIEITDHAYLLMDSSKFGVRDFIKVASADTFDFILTDNEKKIEVLENFADIKDRLIFCNV